MHLSDLHFSTKSIFKYSHYARMDDALTMTTSFVMVFRLGRISEADQLKKKKHLTWQIATWAWEKEESFW